MGHHHRNLVIALYYTLSVRPSVCNEKYNFVTSLQYAAQEFTRFKNKFLTIAGTNRNINPSDPISAVDIILKQINMVKDQTFPWYYSGMVPCGDNKNVIAYQVFNPLQRTYEISEIYNPHAVNNKAIIVYLACKNCTID